MTGSQILVSVVVISKNEVMLDATLDSIEMEIASLAEKRLIAECLVVDASDGALNWISEKHPNVRWIAFAPIVHKKFTIPDQRNEGLRRANGHVIAFCDAGGIPLVNWLLALTRPILDGRLEATCGPVRSKKNDHYGKMNALPNGAIVDSTATCNLALSRSLINRVGEFDETFEYGSDTDYCWRIADVGSQIVNIEAAEMVMDWGTGLLQFRRAWRYGKARGQLFTKFKNRRLSMLTRSSEYPAFAAWFLLLLLAIGSVFLWEEGGFWPLVCVILLLIVPTFRNLGLPGTARIVTLHAIGGVGFLYRVLEIGVMKLVTPSKFAERS